MNREVDQLSLQDLQQLVLEQQDRIRRLEERRAPGPLLRRGRRRMALLAVAVVGALSVSAGAFAAIPARIPDASGIIHGCYAKNGGALRIVSSGSCAQSEKRLSWNQHGKQGPRGPEGPPGPTPKTFCPGCDMTGVDLTSQNLQGAYFAGAKFINAKLTGVNLGSSDLNGAYVGPPVGQTGAGPDMTGANFIDSNLRAVTFANVNAHNATFLFADLEESDLDGGNFASANFNFADLGFATAKAGYFRGATFQGAHIDGFFIQSAVFEDATLEGARGTPIEGSGATYANTVCPDGTNSDSHGNTCTGHWMP